MRCRKIAMQKNCNAEKSALQKTKKCNAENEKCKRACTSFPKNPQQNSEKCVAENENTRCRKTKKCNAEDEKCKRICTAFRQKCSFTASPPPKMLFHSLPAPKNALLPEPETVSNSRMPCCQSLRRPQAHACPGQRPKEKTGSILCFSIVITKIAE